MLTTEIRFFQDGYDFIIPFQAIKTRKSTDFCNLNLSYRQTFFLSEFWGILYEGNPHPVPVLMLNKISYFGKEPFAN
jgi:hypothetical protein